MSQVLVALLAEGVDRNTGMVKTINGGKPSPSSRRAWIEIRQLHFSTFGRRVALLAEGVDRNI